MYMYICSTHESHFEHIYVLCVGKQIISLIVLLLCAFIIDQATNFKPSMFTSCYICQMLCMMLALCGQTLVFPLKTTMVIFETCFMVPRMWMARCAQFSICDN